MKRNIDLILAVAKRIEQYPEQYNQSEYWTVKECGTTCCVAGHAALQAGAKIYWDHEWSSWDIDIPDDANVETFAQKEMGLTVKEAEWLFRETRKESTMPVVLKALAKGADLKTLRALEKGLAEV